MNQSCKVGIYSANREIGKYLSELLYEVPRENLIYYQNYLSFQNNLEIDKPSAVLLDVSNNENPTEVEIYRWIRSNPYFVDLPILLFEPKKENEQNKNSPEAELDKYLQKIYYPLFKEQLILEIVKASSKKKSILFVDDSPIIHKVLHEVLESNQFIIYEGYNGKEGLAHLKRVRPDIIVTDIEMPEMNGYEFCKAVKNNPLFCDIPVLILSSLGSGIEIDRGFDAGANDYLTKPIDIEEFVSRIDNLLQTSVRSTREKILIVDDSNIVVSMMSSGLEQQGFKVFSAPNGEAGLAKAREIQPDLITSDYDMPVMNGWEFCNALRKDPELSKIPTIMITSRESKSDKAKSIGAGVKAYLTKPFTNDKLLAVIERILAEKRIEREKEILKFYVSDAALEAAKEHSMSGHGGPAMRAKEMYATVFFSDIAKFTPICEKLSPREVIGLLNEYFDVMCAEIKKNDGIIDKFIGDAIMAVFSNKEIGAYNAVSAGFGMLTALKKFNENRADPLHMRIGINYGRLFIGDLGSKLYRRDFTVIGDTVNTAQRLESNSKIDGMLISESTYELVEKYVTAEKLGPISLKGKAGEHYAYNIFEVKPRG